MICRASPGIFWICCAGTLGWTGRFCQAKTIDWRCACPNRWPPSGDARPAPTGTAGSTPTPAHLEALGWAIFITNADRQTLSLEQARALYRLRGRIETVFKGWKSNFRMAQVPQEVSPRTVVLSAARKADRLRALEVVFTAWWFGTPTKPRPTAISGWPDCIGWRCRWSCWPRPLSGIRRLGHGKSTTTAATRNAGALTSPERLLEILDRFAEFGLPIRITEFDVNVDDLQLQADYLRDFLTTVFGHPAVIGFQMWGFWENAHWRPEAALLRADWSEKPNALAYKQLLFEDWWTNAQGVTDDAGRFQTRAFYGDYTATISLPDFEETRSLELTPKPMALNWC